MINCNERLNSNNKRNIGIGFDTMEVSGDFIKNGFHEIVVAEGRVV